MPVRFLFQVKKFDISKKRLLKSWITSCALKERKTIEDLSFVFCSDEYLHNLNVTYLSHDTLTDVITFEYSKGEAISGEVYISKDRVKDNSIKYSSTFELELYRVMIHGFLHLCGYKDKSKSDIVTMRRKEDSYLSLLKNVSRETQ